MNQNAVFLQEKIQKIANERFDFIGKYIELYDLGNRTINMIAAVFTIMYIIGGGCTTPNYLIITSIEVVILLIIFVDSWKWKI